MPTVSIITAVHAPAARWLPEAHDSLATQQIPAPWDWEWLVVEDGKSSTVASAIPNDSRVTFVQNQRGGGAGVARNLALGLASGDLVKSLDADDRLTPGVLQRDIEALDIPGIRWATSSVLDLLPSGKTEEWDMDDPPAGKLRKGSMMPFWEEHGRPPVMPGTLAIERSLIDLLGGWMALPISEDTGMLLAASQMADGWFHTIPGLLYRKWPGQTTASDSTDTKYARHSLISRRVAAISAKLGQD